MGNIYDFEWRKKAKAVAMEIQEDVKSGKLRNSKLYEEYRILKESILVFSDHLLSHPPKPIC